MEEGEEEGTKLDTTLANSSANSELALDCWFWLCCGKSKLTCKALLLASVVVVLAVLLAAESVLMTVSPSPCKIGKGAGEVEGEWAGCESDCCRRVKTGSLGEVEVSVDMAVMVLVAAEERMGPEVERGEA